MTGNIWMCLHLLDAEDLDFGKHEFITYKMGQQYYSMGEKRFANLVWRAGAVYKCGRGVIMKIIGKLFAYLLAGILTLVLVAFDLLGRALPFIGVFVILLFGLSLMVIRFKGLWHTLPILIGLFAVCLLVFYGTEWIAGLLSFLRDRLLGQ